MVQQLTARLRFRFQPFLNGKAGDIRVKQLADVLALKGASRLMVRYSPTLTPLTTVPTYREPDSFSVSITHSFSQISASAIPGCAARISPYPSNSELSVFPLPEGPAIPNLSFAYDRFAL